MSGRFVGRFEWERAVRDDPAITRTRHHVLLALATFSNNRDGRVTVGEEKLATVTGLSVSTVREHLTGARETNLLQRITRGHHLGRGRAAASTYQLTLPTQPPAARRLEQEPTASGPAVGDGPNRQEHRTQPPASRQPTASPPAVSGFFSSSYASGGAREAHDPASAELPKSRTPDPWDDPGDPEPPERCPKHLENPTDDPCGGCGRKREAHDQWTVRQEARREAWREARQKAIPNCPDCRGGHYIEDGEGNAITKCTHPRLNEVIANA